jgi:transcriptional regulator with XRE-family HTH domain
MSDWDQLREARRAQRIPLKQIAATLDCDVSYLSHIEHGRRAVTAEIVAAYQAHIRDARIELAKATPREASLSGRVINFCKTFRPYTPERLSNYLKPKYVRNAEVVSGLDSFSRKLLRTRLSENDVLCLVWTNLDEYRDRGIRKKWRTILSKALTSRATIKLLFTPSTNEMDHQEEIKWLIFESLYCLNWKQNIVFDSVSDLQFNHFPIDFFVVENKFAEIRLSGHDYRYKDGLDVREENGAVKNYVRRIESYRDQKIKLFFGMPELGVFFDEFLATESQSGPRYLSQPFPGSHTRPPHDFEEGTNWWTRYAEAGLDVKQLATTRKRATNALRQRMKTHPIRQICSREALQSWAQTGDRTGFRRGQIREDPKDRRNQIQHMINLLKAEPNFAIAIIDHAAGRDLGWSNLNERGSVNWLLQGEEISILEGHTNSLEGTSTEFQCIVRDAGLAAGFKSIFETFWDQLPARTKDPRNTIGFLEGLKDVS